MRDPTTCQEWQEAVNLAEAYLLFDSARQYGLVTGGPESNVQRCEEILKRGRVQGIELNDQAQRSGLSASAGAPG